MGFDELIYFLNYLIHHLARFCDVSYVDNAYYLFDFVHSCIYKKEVNQDIEMDTFMTGLFPAVKVNKRISSALHKTALLIKDGPCLNLIDVSNKEQISCLNPFDALGITDFCTFGRRDDRVFAVSNFLDKIAFWATEFNLKKKSSRKLIYFEKKVSKKKALGVSVCSNSKHFAVLLRREPTEGQEEASVQWVWVMELDLRARRLRVIKSIEFWGGSGALFTKVRFFGYLNQRAVFLLLKSKFRSEVKFVSYSSRSQRLEEHKDIEISARILLSSDLVKIRDGFLCYGEGGKYLRVKII